MTRNPPMPSRLRMREELELRCPWCGEWLPITVECWHMNRWHRCRACENERQRLRVLLKHRTDEVYRENSRQRSLRYRKWLAQVAPDYLPAYERERRARNRVISQRIRDERGAA